MATLSDLINQYYNQYYGRAPESGAVDSWVSGLTGMGISDPNQIAQFFINSPEAQQYAASKAAISSPATATTPAPASVTQAPLPSTSQPAPTSSINSNLITQLYQQYYGRTPSSSDINAWLSNADNVGDAYYGYSPDQLGGIFAGSPEAIKYQSSLNQAPAPVVAPAPAAPAPVTTTAPAPVAPVAEKNMFVSTGQLPPADFTPLPTGNDSISTPLIPMTSPTSATPTATSQFPTFDQWYASRGGDLGEMPTGARLDSLRREYEASLGPMYDMNKAAIAGGFGGVFDDPNTVAQYGANSGINSALILNPNDPMQNQLINSGYAVQDPATGQWGLPSNLLSSMPGYESYGQADAMTTIGPMLAMAAMGGAALSGAGAAASAPTVSAPTVTAGGSMAAADAAGLAQMAADAGLTGQAANAFVTSGGTLGSTTAGGLGGAGSIAEMYGLTTPTYVPPTYSAPVAQPAPVTQAAPVTTSPIATQPPAPVVDLTTPGTVAGTTNYPAGVLTSGATTAASIPPAITNSPVATQAPAPVSNLTSPGTLPGTTTMPAGVLTGGGTTAVTGGLLGGGLNTIGNALTSGVGDGLTQTPTNNPFGIPDNILQGLLQGVGGYLAADSTADTIKSIYDTQRADRSGALSAFNTALTNPNSYYTSPQAMGATDAVLRKLSVQGNPAANPGLLSQAAAYNMGGYNDYLRALSGPAFGTAGSEAALGMNGAGAAGGRYEAIGAGLNTALNKDPYKDLLANLGKNIISWGGINSFR